MISNSFKFSVGWKAPENGRKFLNAFAASKKFNPLDAEKWLSVTCNEIIRAVSFFHPSIMLLIFKHYFKGGGGLLYYYKGSFFRALTELYPELPLKKELFLFSTSLLFLIIYDELIYL